MTHHGGLPTGTDARPRGHLVNHLLHPPRGCTKGPLPGTWVTGQCTAGPARALGAQRVRCTRRPAAVYRMLPHRRGRTQKRPQTPLSPRGSHHGTSPVTPQPTDVAGPKGALEAVGVLETPAPAGTTTTDTPPGEEEGRSQVTSTPNYVRRAVGLLTGDNRDGAETLKEEQQRRYQSCHRYGKAALAGRRLMAGQAEGARRGRKTTPLTTPHSRPHHPSHRHPAKQMARAGGEGRPQSGVHERCEQMGNGDDAPATCAATHRKGAREKHPRYGRHLQLPRFHDLRSLPMPPSPPSLLLPPLFSHLFPPLLLLGCSPHLGLLLGFQFLLQTGCCCYLPRTAGSLRWKSSHL